MNRNIGAVATVCWILILTISVITSASRVDARPYTKVYVFGGMWEEIGNNSSKGRYPEAPYQAGRRTNGKSYVEHLAQKLGMSTMKPSKDGGTNYAWAPSDSPDRPTDKDKTLQMQIDDFEADLEGESADADALYIVGGFQDLTSGWDTTMAAIKRLGTLGAHFFASMEKIEPLALLNHPSTIFNENSTGIDRINWWTELAGNYNRDHGSLAGLARSIEGLSVVIFSYRDWVTAAKDDGLAMNIETPASYPSGSDLNDFFNLIGWGTGSSYSVPSGRAHELLADLAFVVINRRPELVQPIEDLTLSIEDEPVEVDISITFLDPDADRLTYTVEVQVDSVLLASVSGFTLTITPLTDGFTRVTVIATDGINRGLTEQFDVTVQSIPGTISLAVESADFGEIEIKTTATLSITISNTGEGPLNITDVTSDIAGVTPSETEFTIPIGESHDITLTFRPTTEGTISGTLTILSNDAENGTISLSLSGTAIIILADSRTDFNGDGQLSLTDFILFAQNYGSTNPDFDLSGNGRVDLADFIIFVQNYTRPLQ